MSIYSTPLQFGYFLALLFASLFLVRGIKEERLSDRMLALVMFLLAMEIQDYTFGFSGINILWEDLKGFPREFGLAFAPTIFLYLKAQINKEFKFKKKHYLHYLPFFIYFVFNVCVFIGGSAMVNWWEQTDLAHVLGVIVDVGTWVSYIVYFYFSLRMYKDYRQWIKTRFSNVEIISFKWLRNFIFLIIIGEIIKLSWTIADVIVDMPYKDDWWWQLFTVAIICYVGISGFSQRQSMALAYREPVKADDELSVELEETNKNQSDIDDWKIKLEVLFKEGKVFLEPELSLSELASKLKTNTSKVSAVINQSFNKNFNDFVNEHRIKEFEAQIEQPENQNYTRLAVAYDCGFNSKATFNRALKKFGSGANKT